MNIIPGTKQEPDLKRGLYSPFSIIGASSIIMGSSASCKIYIYFDVWGGQMRADAHGREKRAPDLLSMSLAFCLLVHFIAYLYN